MARCTLSRLSAKTRSKSESKSYLSQAALRPSRVLSLKTPNSLFSLLVSPLYLPSLLEASLINNQNTFVIDLPRTDMPYAPIVAEDAYLAPTHIVAHLSLHVSADDYHHGAVGVHSPIHVSIDYDPAAVPL